MPNDDKRQLFLALDEQLHKAEPLEHTNLNTSEMQFVNALRQKGLVTEIPRRLPDDEFRWNFKRIEIIGESLSETIIKERG